MRTRKATSAIDSEATSNNFKSNDENTVNKIIIPGPLTTKDFDNCDQKVVNKLDNDILKRAKIYFSPKENEFNLFCIVCDGKFPDVALFLDHLCKGKLKKNTNKARRSPEESIGTETNLAIGEDSLWHCRICDKGYDKKNSLKKHEQAHILTYTCEICGKGLKSTVNLREHMNIHSGARPYICHLCPMAFARKWGLTSHIRSHIGDKRYGCQYCEKKFINGAILKIHIRMVHTKEKPCQCELCGRHFYSNQLLKEHKKRHLNIRPYKCEYINCGKSFYDRKQLNRHYVSHSDEKPFECTFNNCNSRFARHKTLQAHLKIHSGVKDYICAICGKAFAMNYNLTSHMKTHANSKMKGKSEICEKRQNAKNKILIPPKKEVKLISNFKEENNEQNVPWEISSVQVKEDFNDQTSKQLVNIFKKEKTELNISNNDEYLDDKNLVELYVNINTVPSIPLLTNDKFNINREQIHCNPKQFSI